MTAPTLTRHSLSPKPYGPNPPCLYLDCTYEGPRSSLGLCPTHDQAIHLHGGQRNGPMKHLAETERLELFYKIATLKNPRGRLPNDTDRLPKDHYLRTHTITITQDEHDTAHDILDQMDHAQRSRLLTVEHLPKHLSGRGIAKNPGFVYTVCQAVLLNRYTIKEN